MPYPAPSTSQASHLPGRMVQSSQAWQEVKEKRAHVVKMSGKGTTVLNRFNALNYPEKPRQSANDLKVAGENQFEGAEIVKSEQVEGQTLEQNAEHKTAEIREDKTVHLEKEAGEIEFGQGLITKEAHRKEYNEEDQSAGRESTPEGGIDPSTLVSKKSGGDIAHRTVVNKAKQLDRSELPKLAGEPILSFEGVKGYHISEMEGKIGELDQAHQISMLVEQSEQQNK
ncbi:hypothetical protein LIER_31369 [Lithospermum erythrorhizon]|uniref:Uncharacterized protein n=1 Tax=Lithospermum erythrorhizon TaxID=34254 RepID=A0AAV3RT35_LITER